MNDSGELSPVSIASKLRDWCCRTTLADREAAINSLLKGYVERGATQFTSIEANVAALDSASLFNLARALSLTKQWSGPDFLNVIKKR
jgi:hypothetical protein